MARAFSLADQMAFARLSGDYNPMHVDPVAARRLLFGRPVVHGIHALLWALNCWLMGHGRPVRLKSLKVSFRSPLIVAEPSEVQVCPKGSDGVHIDVVASHGKLFTARVTFAEGSDLSAGVPAEVPLAGVCHDRPAEQWRTAAGSLPLSLNPELAAELFPAALRLLPAEQIAMLLAMTRLVGMEVPGLHSIFSGLDLKDAAAAKSPTLDYAVDSYDDRFSLLSLQVRGPGFTGLLTALSRPSPRTQASMLDLQARIGRAEFRGERALVIGGSRGLGEVAVKELAAGGADVKFSYHVGAADAERVASEVAQAQGHATGFEYDVLRDAEKLPALLGTWSPTLLCYFATPHIATAAKGRFSYATFQAFCDAYLSGFLDTFQAACGSGSDCRNVLYPSSGFIDELPLNMGEYAAAKSAAETLCRFLEKTHAGVRVHCPRFPRLATDQTATVLPSDTSDPAVAVLEVLRGILGSQESDS